MCRWFYAVSCCQWNLKLFTEPTVSGSNLDDQSSEISLSDSTYVEEVCVIYRFNAKANFVTKAEDGYLIL